MGVTGSSYDLFFALGLSSGSYSSKGGIALTAFYDTAAGSTNVLNIWISDTSVAVTSGVSTAMRLFRLASLDEGPTENAANQTSLTALRNAIEVDVSGDRSLDTPVWVGVILEDLPVPTIDLGDGSVARIRVSSEARDAAGSVPGVISGLTITGKDISTLSWSGEPSSSTYDVVRGLLGTLRSTGGDFTASILGCVEDNSGDSGSEEFDSPGVNSGFYYLVRGTGPSGGPGTYDDGGRQVGWRDAEIEAAAGTCP
jgi:hypothetical protein